MAFTQKALAAVALACELGVAFACMAQDQSTLPVPTGNQASGVDIPPASQPTARASAPEPLALALHCAGEARHNAARHSSAVIFGPHGTATAGATTHELQDSDDEVFVRIENGQGRVRVPAIMVPPIHGGGVEGWWQISNLRATDDEITGNISFNVFNNPSIRIDRLNGSIQIEAMAHTGFRGSCAADDVSHRKF